MLFTLAGSYKKVDKMSINTCKARISNAGQTVTTNAVLCTKDVELHIFMLTCTR
jgi:hypothetical protein